MDEASLSEVTNEVDSKEVARARASAKISFIAQSYDIGIEKPDGGIFDAARRLALAERCLPEGDLRAEECIHIGDDEAKDYWGAKGAGWGAVLLQRGKGKEEDSRGEGRERGIGRDTIIRSLDELDLC